MRKLLELRKQYKQYNTCNSKFLKTIDMAILKSWGLYMIYMFGFLFGVVIAYLEFRKAF